MGEGRYGIGYFQVHFQPLFQGVSTCKDQFSFILKLELISITKISQLDSLWRRDWGQVGSGLFSLSSGVQLNIERDIELNTRGEIPYLQAIMYYFVYYIDILPTWRSRLNSPFKTRTRFMALNRAWGHPSFTKKVIAMANHVQKQTIKRANHNAS